MNILESIDSDLAPEVQRGILNNMLQQWKQSKFVAQVNHGVAKATSNEAGMAQATQDLARSEAAIVCITESLESLED